MDVFLVPVGGNRYALYCEAEPAPVDEDAPERQTLWARAVAVFRRMLAEGEEERRRGSSEPAPQRGRVRRWVAMRLASAVAEQRLLWHLRHESQAGLVHPDDVGAAESIALTRARLSHDHARHLRWCVIDSLIAIASIPVALVPGPNLLGYYFLFRAVGHLFSVRGASHGLKGVAWQARGAAPLTALRGALALPASERIQQVAAIARALGLERLPAFVENAARTPAA